MKIAALILLLVFAVDCLIGNIRAYRKNKKMRS